MSADALSQEEIDALLKGAAAGESESESAPGGSGEDEGGKALTGPEGEAVSKYAELMARTQGEMVGTFLTASAESEPHPPTLEAADAIAQRFKDKIVVARIPYEGAIQGASALLFHEADAARIGGEMVGVPDATEFGDMAADAFKEVVNTILGNLNTSLAAPAQGSVSTGVLDVQLAEANGEAVSSALGSAVGLVLVAYQLKVGEDMNVECYQAFAPALVKSMKVFTEPPPPEPEPAPAPTGAAPVTAAPVEFEALTADSSIAGPANLNLIMDIGLEVRVELGRTHMKIRDVLNLGGGSVVELDKLAGEPVDLLVNEVIFAKGEVVVIDENFGVRITDILSLDDRIKTLGERGGV